MATRSRLTRLIMASVVATALSAATMSAAHADAVTASATVTVSSTMSYTATASQQVSSTASWGNPAISKTVTATLSVNDTESATRTATVTQSASGDTPDDAQAAAQSVANFWATLQSQIDAITAASIAASTQASITLATQIAPKQLDLYNQALAQAQAAVIARDGQPTGGKADACGAPQYKSDETPWKCSFDDEFNGKSLDATKWTSWNGVNYFDDPGVCFYNDPSHLAVAGGSLNLSVTKAPSGASCVTSSGTSKPTYAAGVVQSKGKFSQTYGMFQARIKFAGGVGIHNDFWLFPDNTSSGDHAEIDIAEPVGSDPNTMVSAVHRTAPGDSIVNDLGATMRCSVPSWGSSYHTYGLQWTPTQLQFSVDGTVCGLQPNTGEFTRNFFMILQVLADAGSAAPTATTTLPATMSVDWVRVWK